MSIQVTNGQPATNAQVLCGFDPVDVTNKANMKYYAEGACPAEIKKSMLNWMMSAFYCVIDGAGLVLGVPGTCDYTLFKDALLKITDICSRPLRDTSASPLSLTQTNFIIQDCPGGLVQRVTLQQLKDALSGGASTVISPGSVV